MELSALAGNAHVKAVLSQQEGGRGLSHAYILSGPAGSGRHTLARLLCGPAAAAPPAGRCSPASTRTWRSSPGPGRENPSQ